MFDVGEFNKSAPELSGDRGSRHGRALQASRPGCSAGVVAACNVSEQMMAWFPRCRISRDANVCLRASGANFYLRLMQSCLAARKSLNTPQLKALDAIFEYAGIRGDDPKHAYYRSAYALLVHALSAAARRLPTGTEDSRAPLWFEFGVRGGHSLNLSCAALHLAPARRGGLGARVHGFDTFEGLPEAWNSRFGKGALSMHGIVPHVHACGRLHVGLINETLAPFPTTLRAQTWRLLGASIDVDLYGGTISALRALRPWLQPGVLLHFHEFYTGPRRAKAFSRRSLNTLLNTTSDEMRALRDFLVDSKESQQLTLRLLPLRNPRIFDATVFEVV